MSETWLVMAGYHQGRFDDGDSPQCIHASEADAVACAERVAKSMSYERRGPRHWKTGNGSVWVAKVEPCGRRT